MSRNSSSWIQTIVLSCVCNCCTCCCKNLNKKPPTHLSIFPISRPGSALTLWTLPQKPESFWQLFCSMYSQFTTNTRSAKLMLQLRHWKDSYLPAYLPDQRLPITTFEQNALQFYEKYSLQHPYDLETFLRTHTLQMDHTEAQKVMVR